MPGGLEKARRCGWRVFRVLMHRKARQSVLPRWWAKQTDAKQHLCFADLQHKRWRKPAAEMHKACQILLGAEGSIEQMELSVDTSRIWFVPCINAAILELELQSPSQHFSSVDFM